MATSKLSYRQLEAMVMVAEWGNISHAAVQLSMSQPALSRMVSTVEGHFGVDLFDRDTRGVRLTDAGERLVEHARRALRHLDDMEDELRSLDGRIRGKICVVMPGTVGHSLSLPLIDRVAARHPDVELRIMGAHPNNVPLAISAGDADVGIASDVHRLARLSTEPLAVEHLHLVGPPDWAAPDRITLEAVAATPLALPGIQPGLRQLIDTTFASQGRLPNMVMELDSQDALVEMIRRGDVWSIMSFAGVHRLVDRGELRACPIVKPTIDRTLLVGLPENRAITRLMRAVVEEIRATALAVAESARWTVSA